MSKKTSDDYKLLVKKYNTLGLPASIKEFKTLFPNHSKFDKDSFLLDLASTITQELSSRLDWMFYRLYPGEISVLNNERNFLREKYKLYVTARKVQLAMLNSMDKIRIGQEEKHLAEAINESIKFLKQSLWKEFEEMTRIVIDGWNTKFQEKKEQDYPSYIR